MKAQDKTLIGCWDLVKYDQSCNVVIFVLIVSSFEKLARITASTHKHQGLHF